MNKVILYIFILLISPYCFGVGTAINLSQDEFDSRKIYTLQGEWTFTWGSQDAIAVKNFLPWTKYRIDGKELPAFGMGNYQTTIVLPKNAPRKLAIQITRVKTAYALYIDGQLAAHRGALKNNQQLDGSENKSGVIEFDLPQNATSFHISIDVSNNSYYRGGGDQPLLLGSIEKINSKRNLGIVENSIIAGGLFIMGLYHILMWSTKISNSASLFFSVFSTAYSFRLLLTGEKILYIYLPFLSEEMMLRLEIASAFIAIPMMHIFISRVFPNEFNKRFESFSWCAFVVFIAIAVILPLFYVAYAIKALEAYVLFVLFHLLYIGIKAYINKSNGAQLFLLGFIGAFASGINDILFESGLPSAGRYISQYGVLLFIFVQSSIQAMRFASAYSELVILKNSLEDTVIQRTKELTRLSDELSRLSLATSDLLEEERKYIARELHDDLGQTISGLKFRAEHIGNEITKLAKDELSDLVAKAKDIENTLGGMYHRVRSMLRRLRPEIIDTMGLEIALEELLSKYRDGYHIKFRCVGDIIKTSEHRSIFIYRICQEAITNIVKYADASTITINLVANERINISIQDNGVGFDVDNPKNGTGLISMRERTLSLGGTFSIHSDPGFGTLIEISIPNT